MYTTVEGQRILGGAQNFEAKRGNGKNFWRKEVVMPFVSDATESLSICRMLMNKYTSEVP